MIPITPEIKALVAQPDWLEFEKVLSNVMVRAVQDMGADPSDPVVVKGALQAFGMILGLRRRVDQEESAKAVAEARAKKWGSRGNDFRHQASEMD